MAAHSLPACAPPEGLSGSLELRALGDFPETNRTTEVIRLDSAPLRLAFPPELEAISLSLRTEDTAWIGLGVRDASDRIDALLWPEANPCEIFRVADQSPYPAAGGGQAIGYSAQSGTLLVAGGNAGESAAVVGALSFDTRTGQVSVVSAAERHVLLEPRAYATATDFAGKLLVAGGEDPLIFDLPPEERALRSTAEVFDPDLSRFELEPIALRVPRSRHAALVLPSGDTLLVGGRGPSNTALRVLEAVSPDSRTSSVAGLSTLKIGRISPRVVPLSNGRILVADGLTAGGAQIFDWEWLDSQGAELKTEPNAPELPPRVGRAFAAMPGGGFLVVGGCEDREPETAAEASACSACRQGCPPSAGWDGYWVDPDGVATALEIEFPVPQPILIAGSEGRPWLVAHATRSDGSLDPEHRMLLRFDPWQLHFEPVELEVELPKPSLPAPVALDAGAMVWIAESTAGVRLLGFRAHTRNLFSRDLALLQTTAAGSPMSLLHVVPERAPSPETVRYTGQLELIDGRVWVSETRYAALEIELKTQSGPAPIVWLGGTPLGGPACPWPPSEASPMGETLRITRAGAEAVLHRGGSTRTCTVTPERLAVGLQASPDGPTELSSLEVRRK